MVATTIELKFGGRSAMRRGRSLYLSFFFGWQLRDERVVFASAKKFLRASLVTGILKDTLWRTYAERKREA